MIVVTVNELPAIQCRVRHLSSAANAAQEIEQIAARFADEFGRRPETIYRCWLTVAVPLESGDADKIAIMPLEFAPAP